MSDAHSNNPPTIGLKGLGPIERLERTGLSNWKLYWLITAGCLILTLPMLLITDRVNPDSAMREYFTPTILVTTLYANFVLIGMSAFVAIILARTTEADLRSLARLDGDLDKDYLTLKPGRVSIIASTATAIALLLLFSPLSYMGRYGVSFSVSLGHHLDAGLAPAIIFFVAPVFAGASAGALFVVIKSQIQTLNLTARTIRIELLNLFDYQAIANPLMRYLLVVLVVLSGVPLVTTYIDNASFTGGAAVAVSALVVTYVPVIVGYFLPILILRNRIRDAKQAELRVISLALSGDEAAISALRQYTPDLPGPDLLTRQMFVESRWEWPIASHIQKLLAFGMLPPFTWAMAAVVENLMF